MAEVDTRIETLEDEIKVLKGEVRRTLVDLRALLMREDSPLNEGTFGRTAALQNPEIGGEPTVTRKEVSDMMRQETVEAARPLVEDTPPQTPPPPNNPGQPVAQGIGMATPGSGFPGMTFPQVPITGVGGGYPPVPPQASPLAPQAPDPAMAERERKLAEQERRMEEQERRLADQERRLASAARSEDAAERDSDQRVARYEPAQQSPEAAVPRAEPEKPGGKKESDRELDQGKQTPPSQDRWNEYHDSEGGTIPPRRSSSFDRGKSGPSEKIEDKDRQQPEFLQTVWSGDKDTLEIDTERVVRRPPRNRQSPEKPERWRVNDGEDDEERTKAVTGNGRGNRVYDEYFELLAETEELELAEDANLGALPLDVNLLSSLTRWTSVARNRVGGQRLTEILDLYSQSGHLSASLRELLEQISGLVDDAQPEPSEDAQVLVDLIFHLHGIIAGNLAIRQIQQAKPVI